MTTQLGLEVSSNGKHSRSSSHWHRCKAPLSQRLKDSFLQLQPCGDCYSADGAVALGAPLSPESIFANIFPAYGVHDISSWSQLHIACCQLQALQTKSFHVVPLLPTTSDITTKQAKWLEALLIPVIQNILVSLLTHHPKVFTECWTLHLVSDKCIQWNPSSAHSTYTFSSMSGTSHRFWDRMQPFQPCWLCLLVAVEQDNTLCILQWIGSDGMTMAGSRGGPRHIISPSPSLGSQLCSMWFLSPAMTA